MSASRRASCLANKSRVYFHKSFKSYISTSHLKPSTGNDEIVIPYRIERGPTDILKALASTVSKDFTAPQFKYEDDPYFIPVSNVTKRAFALSKESGKKAARYFLEKYPELFKCHSSVPHIKQFDPPMIYTEDNVFNSEPLKDCIYNYDVENSVIVYNILKKKEIFVEQYIKQDLLELLCFYNCTQPISEDYYEERYYQRSDARREKWKRKGMAETLFQEMKQDSKAYSAMIAGASKFTDTERAFSLYEEMKNNHLTCTVEAFNGLLSVVPLTEESGDNRWEHAMSLVSNMVSRGLRPDLYTMNALLSIISKTRQWRKSKSIAQGILSEMKRLNIDPSLGTYHEILQIFCLDGRPAGNILNQIMNDIGEQELFIRHPSDVLFFSTAMEVCWKIHHDKVLAYRIHKLLEFKNNCKLLGNALSESQYFKCFFRLLCEAEDLDTFMEVYDKYIPNTYTPEPSVTLHVIQAIHLAGLYKYLPRLCSDVSVFEQTERENIMHALTEAAGCMKHEQKIQEELVDLIWKIIEKLENRSKIRRLNLDWTGTILGNILKTFLYAKDLEKSWSIMQKLKREEMLIIGHPEKDCLLSFCELNLEVKDYEKVKFCVKYAVNGNYPDFREDLGKLVSEMYDKEMLRAEEKSNINSILYTSTLPDDISSGDSSGDDMSSSNSSSDGLSSGDSSSDDE